jgi:hypothetical protein
MRMCKDLFVSTKISLPLRGRQGRDHMIVGFTKYKYITKIQLYYKLASCEVVCLHVQW